MISLTTADAALKDAYLAAACNQLNTKTNPLLSRIKQSTANVVGKHIIKACQVGLNGGIGAGSETGMLPVSSGNNYKQFKSTLKNLYGTFEISDKAIRASATNAGAFVNLLNGELDGLLTASKFNLSRMLFGDGTGKVATVTAYESGVATLDSVKNLMEGMVVDIYNAAGTPINGSNGLKITKVDRLGKKIAFEIAPTTAPVNTNVLYVQGSKDNEITGLGAIFAPTGSLYGLDKESNSWLTPYINKESIEINDNTLQTAIDFLEENTGSNIDFITCGSGLRRVYQQYLSAYKRNIDVTTLEGGSKAISFNGIPMVSDRFVEDNTLYMLDTSKFTLHELCDWEWLEGDNGRIIRQKPGYAAYTATLVKYADLICDLPSGQGKFTNFKTTVTPAV